MSTETLFLFGTAVSLGVICAGIGYVAGQAHGHAAGMRCADADVTDTLKALRFREEPEPEPEFTGNVVPLFREVGAA